MFLCKYDFFSFWYSALTIRLHNMLKLRNILLSTFEILFLDFWGQIIVCGLCYLSKVFSKKIIFKNIIKSRIRIMNTPLLIERITLHKFYYCFVYIGFLFIHAFLANMLHKAKYEYYSYNYFRVTYWCRIFWNIIFFLFFKIITLNKNSLLN